MGNTDVMFADDRNRFAEVMAAFDEGRFASVHYITPIGAGWPNGRRHDRVHEVDLGVEVVLDSGSVVCISWAMAGAIEGLSLSVRAIGDVVNPDNLTHAIDATGLEQWRSLLGRSLILEGAAVHLPEEGNREAVWSVRLSAGQFDPIVVALGEDSGRALSYLPDSLVVIFDEEIARSYSIPFGMPPSRVSAWGAKVAV